MLSNQKIEIKKLKKKKLQRYFPPSLNIRFEKKYLYIFLEKCHIYNIFYNNFIINSK